VTLPPGGSQSFTWTIAATSAGAVAFTATATGINQATGYPVVASAQGSLQILKSILIYSSSQCAQCDSPRYHSIPGTRVTVWNDATWSSKTTADFARFDAIIIGGSGAGNVSAWDTANANKNVWGPALTGNKIVAGSDPEEHTPSKAIIQKLRYALDCPHRQG
jgi:hypothetical protein